MRKIFILGFFVFIMAAGMSLDGSPHVQYLPSDYDSEIEVVNILLLSPSLLCLFSLPFFYSDYFSFCLLASMSICAATSYICCIYKVQDRDWINFSRDCIEFADNKDPVEIDLDNYKELRDEACKRSKRISRRFASCIVRSGNRFPHVDYYTRLLQSLDNLPKMPFLPDAIKEKILNYADWPKNARTEKDVVSLVPYLRVRSGNYCSDISYITAKKCRKVKGAMADIIRCYDHFFGWMKSGLIEYGKGTKKRPLYRPRYFLNGNSHDFFGLNHYKKYGPRFRYILSHEYTKQMLSLTYDYHRDPLRRKKPEGGMWVLHNKKPKKKKTHKSIEGAFLTA